MMAQPDDSRIERRLQRVVQHAVQNGETITVKTVRAQVEKELGLDAGFFKDHEVWKNKSKEIIQAAVEDAPEVASTKTSEPAAAKSKNKKGAAQTVDERDKDHPKHNAASTPAKQQQQVAPSPVRADVSAKGKSTAQVNGVKRKAATPEASYTSDSESEDDSSSSEEEPPQKKQKNSSGSDSSGSSSEDDSDSEEAGDQRKSAEYVLPVPIHEHHD